MPRKKYDEVKVNFVGRFFEDLTRAVLVCERAPVEEGDFHIWDQGLGIEVKASDINHEFRLPLHQINSFRTMSSGFPFNDFLFFLFCYENPVVKNNDQNRVTSLSRHSEKVPIRNFLAQNLSTLFILDMTVIDSLFSFCRISDKSIPLHRGVKSLNIRPAYLKRLVDGGWKALISNHGTIETRSFVCKLKFNPDLLESYDMNFKIEIIRRVKKAEQLLNLIHPQVSLT